MERIDKAVLRVDDEQCDGVHQFVSALAIVWHKFAVVLRKAVCEQGAIRLAIEFGGNFSSHFKPC